MNNPLLYGSVSEWFKEIVLKTIDGKTSVGSKPTTAAIWPVSQKVKTLPLHGGDIGSIPVQVIFLKIKYCEVFKMKTTKKDWIYRVILLILLAIIWDIGAALTSPIFVPQKGAVFREFFLLIQNGTMLKAFRYSLIRITAAALLSAGIAVPLGCLMKICHPIQNLLYPAIRAMRFLPVTAFYPLLTMWFGIGEQMKIAFLFVASFVFMLPSVLIALDDVSDDVIEAASIDGAGKFNTVTRIILPIAAPSICQSFATMYAIGWTYIAVAETVNAKYGIGYLIYTSSARGRTTLVFVGILAIVIFSIMFDWITSACIKKIFKWKFS